VLGGERSKNGSPLFAAKAAGYSAVIRERARDRSDGVVEAER
jgi:hypothetical protein